jgi:hypothetical protein
LARKGIPDPERIRTLEGTNFGWVDRALVHTGFLSEMKQEEFVLYTFLCLVADKYGVSFYGIKKMKNLLKMGHTRLQSARDALAGRGLITFEIDPKTNQVIYQVLPLPIDKVEIESRRKQPAIEEVKQVVDEFYKALKVKASTEKKRKGYDQAARLLKDGFSVDEIRFASEWAVRNMDQPHSFGIVAETIGQALVKKERSDAAKARILRNGERLAREREEITQEREMDGLADRLIARMTGGERQRLRRQALDELGASYDTVKFEAGRRVLLEMQEREIVKRERTSGAGSRED